MGRVQGKVALVTGAGRGQGRSHAIVLASEGANIAAIDLGDQRPPGALGATASQADLTETIRLVKQTGARALALAADISNEEQISHAVAGAIAEFGQIDILVANAGVIDRPTPSWEITKSNWDAMLAVNLTGTWLTCKYVARQMISQGSGSMILVSSIGGVRATPFLSSYSVSKWGVRGLMLNLANELGYSDVRVNSIHPGTVDTPMIDSMAEMMGSTREQEVGKFAEQHILKSQAMLDPKDISAAVLYLASDESRFVTGQELVIDKGASAKV